MEKGNLGEQEGWHRKENFKEKLGDLWHLADVPRPRGVSENSNWRVTWLEKGDRCLVSLGGKYVEKTYYKESFILEKE